MRNCITTKPMENRQTAVEWFYQRILANDIKSVYEQAKAMEKEQIETAYERALNFPWALGCEIDNYQEEAKQYYESNYGK